MSCAPFSNPLDNALSYLYTNKAIDENMNVKSNKINTFISILEKQVDGKLFDIVNNKLVPIQEAFDKLIPESDEIDSNTSEDTEISEKDYVDQMEKDRMGNSSIWQDSVVSLPKYYSEEQQQYLTELLDKGILKLRC